MRGAEAIDQVMHTMNVFEVSAASDIPIHVPFQIGDVTGTELRIKHTKEMVTYVSAGQVQHGLVTLQCRCAGICPDPRRMFACKVAVRIDHFRFNPETERHAKTFDMVGKRRESVRKLGRVACPVAEACLVIVAPLEPAIIKHKALGTYGRGLVGERLEGRHVMIEVNRFPRVVVNRARLRCQVTRQDLAAHERVQHLRDAVEAILRMRRMAPRRRIAGLNMIRFIKQGLSVKDHVAFTRPLGGNAMASAPAKRERKNAAMVICEA